MRKYKDFDAVREALSHSTELEHVDTDDEVGRERRVPLDQERMVSMLRRDGVQNAVISELLPDAQQNGFSGEAKRKRTPDTSHPAPEPPSP